MQCANNCPSNALEVVGQEMDVYRVIEEVEKDRPFYYKSEGGVTLSGGEPLMKWNFSLDLLRRCKELNLHTVVDTSGYTKWEIIERFLPYVDLWLYDIKILDSEKHRRLTGKSNEVILNNLSKLVDRAKVWVRLPLLPGLNDTESDLKELGLFVRKLCTEKVYLLPYHKFGVSKYDKLGRQYSFNSLPVPSQAEIERASILLASLGISITVHS
jgi:pyruvate formate lyase activating enzyme